MRCQDDYTRLKYRSSLEMTRKCPWEGEAGIDIISSIEDSKKSSIQKPVLYISMSWQEPERASALYYEYESKLMHRDKSGIQHFFPRIKREK